MDLLKHYGKEELARLTYRKLTEKRNKKKRDVDNFIADRIKAYYSKRSTCKEKLKIW